MIPGILQELGVADPGLGGWIEVGYGYPPAMVAVPEEHAPPDGRDRGAFGRWEAQRSKLDHAVDPLFWDSEQRAQRPAAFRVDQLGETRSRRYGEPSRVTPH